ncbi:MAG: polyketide cyclase [Frankiales bacterium]|nr:polyketide cyclase [Frankiales bacterium]
MTATLVLTVDVDAPVERTWAGATDWAGQGQWMLGTQVRPTRQDGRGVGGVIEAFTGVGPVGFLDTMEITLWEPPHRCHVLHTGRLVKGTGAFEVHSRGVGRSRFVWREDLELPLGLLGRIGWPLVKPFFAYGVKLSLTRFARWVEAGHASAPRT